MYELNCPSCTSPSHYNISDFLLICPYCSTTFSIDAETNRKELFGDHFIIPNQIDATRIKNSLYEWIKRVHHKPQNVEKEFFVTDIKGISIPHWVVSFEVHTSWKGLIERRKRGMEHRAGGEFLQESGTFRKSYRWAVSARNNICEYWGLQRLHEPPEAIPVRWDGFPLDSTFSRGRLLSTEATEEEAPAFDRREYFEFKYSNGLSILGIQVPEDEAMRRAKSHIDVYHRSLAELHCDYLVDYRTEIDIAGIQLVHLPFWNVTYFYRPQSFLRYFVPPKEFHALFDGVSAGVLRGEIALRNKDKVWVNSVVSAACALIFFILGAGLHPAFFFVSLFFGLVSGASAYMAIVKEGNAGVLKTFDPSKLVKRETAG